MYSNANAEAALCNGVFLAGNDAVRLVHERTSAAMNQNEDFALGRLKWTNYRKVSALFEFIETM